MTIANTEQLRLLIGRKSNYELAVDLCHAAIHLTEMLEVGQEDAGDELELASMILLEISQRVLLITNSVFQKGE